MELIRNFRQSLRSSSAVSAALALAVLVGLVFLLRSVDLGLFGQGDFLQYWSAGKLFASGGNPYDLSEMAAVEQPYNFAPVTILLWVPPTIFPIVALFSRLEFQLAVCAWLVSMCALFALSLRMLFCLDSFVPQTREKKILAAIFLVTFYPLALSLYYGQISPLLLFGFAAFLFVLLSKGSDRVAGLALSLTLLKPHLLYVVYLYLALKAWKTARWGIVQGLVGGAAILLSLSILLRPDILSLYAHAISTPPIYWQTPTLGSWLQGALDIHETWIRLLPSFLGILLVGLYLLRHEELSKRDNFGLIYALAPLSLLTSPYGWQFDHVVLLPIACYCVVRVQGLLPWLLVLGNIFVLAAPDRTPMQYFLWYPFLFFVVAALERKAAD
jgi:hypothetical protein